MSGDEAMISSVLDLKASGTVPIDRILAPLSVGLTGLFIILTAFLSVTTGKKTIGAQPDKT
jgi:hypothetical protein